MRSLNTAATGMLAQQLNVEVISNNIANLNTTGFKRQRAEFQDLLYQAQRRAGTAASDAGGTVPAGIQIGLGVKPTAVYRIHEQGSLLKTDNSLDLAIQGRGFFQVTLPTGETAYTRAGSFQLNNQGSIVTADGFAVVGPGQVPNNATSISVNQSGQVFVQIPGQTALQQVGQFTMAAFINEAGLIPIGNTNFLTSAASGDAIGGTAGTAGFGTLQQGFVEGSNVNSVNEITSLITAQRAYEMNSKIIQASDQMLNTVNQMR
ncbi:MAG: flagellar basal-body rod protein FlgG [Telmatospirillum sp.]|jgi:flagellar basal-body rod protein FlgG|nr:flagellar basal-body rod protein FlgG [Telmatospirillum sp.]MCZ8311126.1 flagellar basal-body rod protein FlgG [Magnetospirillum sp.]